MPIVQARDRFQARREPAETTRPRKDDECLDEVVVTLDQSRRTPIRRVEPRPTSAQLERIQAMLWPLMWTPDAVAEIILPVATIRTDRADFVAWAHGAGKRFSERLLRGEIDSVRNCRTWQEVLTKLDQIANWVTHASFGPYKRYRDEILDRARHIIKLTLRGELD